MTGKTNLIVVLLCVIAPCFVAHAHTAIEPPVRSNAQKDPINHYDYTNLSTLESNVVWRGLSLTKQQPGWTSLNTAQWQRKFFNTTASYNLYSYASNTTPPNITVNGNTATTSYLMTESKLGTQITMGRKPKHKVKIGVNRVIYGWPGGSNWIWTVNCDATNDMLLSSPQSISSTKTTEYTVSWQDFSLLYAVVDKSSTPTVDTTNSAGAASKALMGIYWGDYTVVTTPTYDFNAYSLNFSASYWNDIGHNYEANVYYHFSKNIVGLVKIFDFIGASGYDNNSGASGILQFKYHASNHK